jgi:hypothetical protein
MPHIFFSIYFTKFTKPQERMTVLRYFNIMPALNFKAPASVKQMFKNFVTVQPPKILHKFKPPPPPF